MPKASAAFRAYRCRDGWLQLACMTEQHWQSLAKTVGRPELAYPHTWEIAAATPADGPLARILEPIFLADTAVIWLERLQQKEVPCSVIEAATDDGRD